MTSTRPAVHLSCPIIGISPASFVLMTLTDLSLALDSPPLHTLRTVTHSHPTVFRFRSPSYHLIFSHVCTKAIIARFVPALLPFVLLLIFYMLGRITFGFRVESFLVKYYVCRGALAFGLRSYSVHFYPFTWFLWTDYELRNSW